MESPKTPTHSSTRKVAFSPVNVAVSPASRIKQHGNLTGLPRTIRDEIADMHSLIQKWNQEHLDGCMVITKLEEVKKEEFLNDKTDKRESLQPLCDLLEKSCNAMREVVEQLQQKHKSMQAIEKLATMQNKSDSTPIFLTWPVSKFVDTVHTVASVYALELKTKQLVLRKVARTTNETELTFYVASWIQQPIVFTSKLTIKIEAALLETGLR